MRHLAALCFGDYSSTRRSPPSFQSVVDLLPPLHMLSVRFLSSRFDVVSGLWSHFLYFVVVRRRRQTAPHRPCTEVESTTPVVQNVLQRVVGLAVFCVCIWYGSLPVLWVLKCLDVFFFFAPPTSVLFPLFAFGTCIFCVKSVCFPIFATNHFIIRAIAAWFRGKLGSYKL